MLADRLPLALDADWLAGEGPIAVFGARGDDDFPGIDPARLTMVQRFRPDHDALAARGFAVVTALPGPVPQAIVCLPRARDAARADIAAAAALTGGRVVVDGARTDGVDGIRAELKKLGALEGAISKAHGRILLVDMAGVPGRAPGMVQNPAGYWTAPGVFSADGVDAGSALLAGALPGDLGGRVADLGSGWGFLAATCLQSGAVTECHLVDADHVALDCARRNVTDARARFHWADVTRWQPPAPCDHVLCNPPFHQTRRPDPDLGRGFIAAAARALAPKGTLWLVANRHLPYEAALEEAFAEVTEIGGNAAFRLTKARRPRRRR